VRTWRCWPAGWPRPSRPIRASRSASPATSETVHWFAPEIPDSALALVHVGAVGAAYPRTGDRPAYSDSARVTLRFAPTGQPARPAPEIVLRLDVP